MRTDNVRVTRFVIGVIYIKDDLYENIIKVYVPNI